MGGQGSQLSFPANGFQKLHLVSEIWLPNQISSKKAPIWGPFLGIVKTGNSQKILVDFWFPAFCVFRWAEWGMSPPQSDRRKSAGLKNALIFAILASSSWDMMFSLKHGKNPSERDPRIIFLEIEVEKIEGIFGSHAMYRRLCVGVAHPENKERQWIQGSPVFIAATEYARIFRNLFVVFELWPRNRSCSQKHQKGEKNVHPKTPPKWQIGPLLNSLSFFRPTDINCVYSGKCGGTCDHSHLIFTAVHESAGFFEKFPLVQEIKSQSQKRVRIFKKFRCSELAFQSNFCRGTPAKIDFLGDFSETLYLPFLGPCQGPGWHPAKNFSFWSW